MAANSLSDLLRGFGVPDRPPDYQPPASVAEQQEKLDRQLTIVERLKATRLAAQPAEPEKPKGSRKASAGQDVEAPGADQPVFCYDVVRHRGHWRVRHIGRHIGAHSNPEAAVSAAMKLAGTKQKQGHATQIRLHRTDGQTVDIPDRDQ